MRWVAATEKGGADRILKVKAAEGDAQSKALQGRGIADQRQAIVAGLRDSVDEFQRSVRSTTAKDVMNLVLMTQYFDTLKEIGASSRSNTILIPHSPGSLASLSEQIRNAMIEANQTVEGSKVRPEALAPAGKGECGIAERQNRCADSCPSCARLPSILTVLDAVGARSGTHPAISPVDGSDKHPRAITPYAKPTVRLPSPLHAVQCILGGGGMTWKACSAQKEVVWHWSDDR
jgi:hypothetical protein